MGIATVSALAAHLLAWAGGGGLAWAGGVFLAFGSDYSGSETSVEVYVRGAILLLLTPVVLTGIALAAALLVDGKRSIRWRTIRTMLLWSTAIVLLGLSTRAGLTYFVLYLPAALALLVAAIADSMVTRRDPSIGP